MKFYTGSNVYDEALNRIRYLFDEFPNVVANISGGKDSTVIFNLAMTVAKEKNRLPLKVLFLDQEAEYKQVIDHVREIMNRPDVEPMWLQIPFRLSNSTSLNDGFFHCWDENEPDKWTRPKEPNSIHKNRYGTDRFKQIFDAVMSTDFAGVKTCFLTGVRAEESPARKMGLVNDATYKHITYGRKIKHDLHYVFCPIYDWSWTDVWKAIHSNKWPYSRLYDLYYANGQQISKMRISSVLHETSIVTLLDLQEYDKELYNKLLERVPTISDIKHLKRVAMTAPKELPFMFKDWVEYRDHLLRYLPSDEYKPLFTKAFANMDRRYSEQFQEPKLCEKLMKVQINTLLANDYSLTKLSNYASIPNNFSDKQKIRNRNAAKAG